MGMDFTFRNPVSGPCLLFFSSLSFSSLWGAQEMKCFLCVFVVLTGESGPDVLAGWVFLSRGLRGDVAGGHSVVCLCRGRLGSPVLRVLLSEVLTYRFGICPVC